MATAQPLGRLLGTRDFDVAGFAAGSGWPAGRNGERLELAHKAEDRGLFARGAMQKPFEDAAFALAVGELSPLVFTDSGVHVILRTA